MNENEIDRFLADVELLKSPEVGSRAMHDLYIGKDNNVLSHWTEVQLNIYSYCVTNTIDKLSVRMIIGNYLAAEVIW